MAVPRPQRRATLPIFPALLLLILTGLALCLPRLLPGARASNALLNATLGNYADTSVQLGKNASVTPDAAPVDATSINVSTSTLFKGTLEADPSTGVVRVTNAHPAGTYTVRLFAFDPNTGTTDSKSFLLTVTTTPACSSPTLGFQSVTLNAGAASAATAVGDFNGDGKQDVVTANSGANNVSVNLGDGAGGFGAATTFVVGSQPRSVAVGDFNGDGAQDLAVANFAANSVAIFAGNGDGTFDAGATLSVVGTNPSSVAVGDFNNDAKQDLVTADSGAVGASVFLGDGNGGFVSAGSPAMGNQPRSVAVGDFNNDGNADIVTANSGANNISINLGNGAGSFGGPTDFAAGSKPESVVVADFNGDGKQDVAAANTTTNNVSIFIGDGTGAVAVASPVGVGTTPFSVAAGDFDGDGKQDLAVANAGANNLSISLGDGAGGFGAPTNFAAGGEPRHVAVADFNGDGKQDLAAANFGTGTVTVLVRQCPPPANTLMVTNTNDSGAGSLRQAITVANNAPGTQTIAFQILGAGVHTISPLSALPDITDRVVIDGFTQPGFAGTPVVELNGSGAGQVTAGLNVVSGGSTIQGLNINNFNGHGVRLGAAGANTVRANFIGTNSLGNAAHANSGHGLFIDNTPNNTVGGAAAGDGNVISGNNGQGVLIDGSGATGNSVAGNFIGTNAGGTAALGNAGSGVFISDAPSNAIGGQGAGNVISSNQNHGVLISGANATLNFVQTNLIGASTDPTVPLGNGLDGVRVDNSSGNTIGGANLGEENTVANNGQDGVQINSGTGNRVLGNSIRDNGTTAQHLGIDLSPDGVTPNDAGDADTGPNNLQNFPVITSARLTGGHALLAGTLDSTANATFRVEFFNGGACDASGSGEGGLLINSTSVTTDAAGGASFNVDFFPTDVSVGDSITATATNTTTGDTSEFSQCVTALGVATWHGAADGNWHNGANWANDVSPSPNHVIVIPSAGVTNEPVISAADAVVAAVNVQAGRTLTIGSARTLTAASVTVDSGGALNVPAGETGRVNANVTLNGTLTGGAGSVFDFLGSQIQNNGTVSVPIFRFAGASQVAGGAGLFTSADTFVVDGSTVTLDTGHEFGALTVNNNATLGQSGNATLTVGKLTIDSGGLLRNLGSGDLVLKGDVANAGTIQLNGAGAACGDADTLLIRSSAAGARRAWSGAGSFKLTDVEVQDQAGSAAIQVLSGTNSGNVGPNWTFADCGGVPLTFAVGGRVVDASNQPIVGVNVHLDGTTARDTTTDAGGNYTFAGLTQQGNFTVTPTETNYRFNPASRSVNNLQSDQAAVDFAGALVNHSIAGTILDGEGHPVSGVTVTLAGARSDLTTTDAGGNYSFANVPEGGSFTVTPDRGGFTFNPPRRQVPNVTTDVDFDAVATAQASPTPDPSDDFSGGPDPDFDKWSKGILTNPPTGFDPLAQVFLAGGLLHVQPRDNANGLSFNGLVSARALDLDTTPVVSVEVVAASQGEGAQTLFGLGRDQNNWLRFAVQDTTTVSPSSAKPSPRAPADGGASNNPSGQTLLFEINAGGSKTSFGIEYDPSVQRFWRFRFDAPSRTVIFETSPDSATWTVRLTAALPADQTALIAELSAGTFKATASPTEALFDNYLLSPTPRVQFSATAYGVNESDGTARVQVIRTGSDESTAAVNFATSDGTARAGSDYTATSGTILFQTGERTKTVTIPILNDNAIEDGETVNLTLTNSVGARLGSITNSVLTILDDESPNQIDQTVFFVRQHYLDFLGREPDAAGLQFWTNNVESCGANAQCREVKRIDTSAAFFLSIEFQETDLVVQRFYEASFNRPPAFDEYLPDLSVIREGVVVGQPDAMARLETNKRLFAELWVNRAAFRQAFGGLNEMQYVDTLLANAGITLTEGERTALVVGLLTNRETRAGVLLKIIEKEEFKRREFNAAFVRMEYFGYLRRTPDPVGFGFWLKKMEDFGGDYRRAEMVKAFLSSTEYRARFGQP
ncbi:MAG TPA: FG-GAP-like repeat-containing protein [Pyrinomonadaceae bacterium]|nr:FG-GAP-like repeat-containing protein [Pyrinomonadaceae bacterium]